MRDSAPENDGWPLHPSPLFGMGMPLFISQWGLIPNTSAELFEQPFHLVYVFRVNFLVVIMIATLTNNAILLITTRKFASPISFITTFGPFHCCSSYFIRFITCQTLQFLTNPDVSLAILLQVKAWYSILPRLLGGSVAK